MRARLGRYAWWQLRDYVFERGMPIVIVSSLLLLQAILVVRALARSGAAPSIVQPRALDAFVGAASSIAIVGTLLAVNGVISSDRKNGYFRFLFAKPVSTVAYYAQSYVVNGIGLAATALALLALFAATAYPIFPLEMVAYVAVVYLGFGGIGFLLSALTRFDWVAMGATWLVAQLLRALYPVGQSWQGDLFHTVLPPLHLLGEIGNRLLHGQPLPVSGMIWLLGWGLGAFLAGLLVLRWRPLAS
ncbi:MAG: hypothetical protein ACREON_09870 [Gemmatimonadaceae bacterium]